MRGVRVTHDGSDGKMGRARRFGRAKQDLDRSCVSRYCRHRAQRQLVVVPVIAQVYRDPDFTG